MIEVITGFSPDGYSQYGKRFMRTFKQYWRSGDFVLYPYVEESIGWASERDLQDIIDLSLFFYEYDNDRSVKGLVPNDTWKLKERDNGYSYRFDAFKFCRIPYIIEHAIMHSKHDYLIWIDGDTYAFDTVTKQFFMDLIGDNDCVYLGRAGTHSECGFLMFRTNKMFRFVSEWVNYYRTGSFKQCREWHNSYLFDLCKETFKKRLRFKNLTPQGKGHVWFQSPIGKKLDHIKGNRRKELGYSPERHGVQQ